MAVPRGSARPYPAPMRRLLVVLACVASAFPSPAQAAPPSPNANVGVLRGTATYSNQRPRTPVSVYWDLAFAGTFTAAGTRGVPQTYGCTLAGTIEAGAPTAPPDSVALGEGGYLTGACGPFTAVTCFYGRQYYESSTLTCGQGIEGFFGYGLVTPPLEPAVAPVVEWTFALVDATNTCANLGCY